MEGGLHHGRGEENRQQQEDYCDSALSSIWEKMDCCTGIAEQNTQLLLPKCFRSTVFKELHQEMGHLGADRVIQLARERFYWPKMVSDIIHFVTQACPCLKQRQPNLSTHAPLTSVTTSSLFELVSI